MVTINTEFLFKTIFVCISQLPFVHNSVAKLLYITVMVCSSTPAGSSKVVMARIHNIVLLVTGF